MNASNAGLAWLSVLLAKEKLGSAPSFFGTVKESAKPQECVWPLFFGAVDACVVDELNLELLREMNPQLASLLVIARSNPLIESVIATPADRQPYRDELLEAMLSLHQDPQGRQLLMVFKTAQLQRIRPADLDATRKFWAEYNRLTGAPLRPTVRKPPPGGGEED